MLLRLARLTMRGPWIAILMVAVTGLLALPFGPALFVSGALVALVTLRQGPAGGLRVVAGAAALLGAGVLALSGRVGPAVLTIGVLWFAVWSAAGILRADGRQGLAVSALGLWTAGYATAMRLGVADVDEFWTSRLRALNAGIEAQGGEFLTTAQLDLYGGMMHEASIAMLYLMLGSMLMLGRYWQAGLYNPGGFRTEFRTLSLPGGAWAAGALVALASMLSRLAGKPVGVLEDLLLLAVMVFSWQGLAVMHARILAGMHWLWAWGFYSLFLALPQLVVLVLAGIGISDRYKDYRRLRVQVPQKPEDTTGQA